MSAAWQEQNGGQKAQGSQSARPAPIQFYGGYQVYSESGIDLTLLRENLKKTVTERLEKNQRGLELVKEVDKSRLAKTRSHLSRESSLMLQDCKIIQQRTDNGSKSVR